MKLSNISVDYYYSGKVTFGNDELVFNVRKLGRSGQWIVLSKNEYGTETWSNLNQQQSEELNLQLSKLLKENVRPI